MLAVQKTDVLTANHPASDQIRKVSSNLTGAPSNHNKIFTNNHPEAPTRTLGAQDLSATIQGQSTTSSSAMSQSQRTQRNIRPPLLETPRDLFKMRTLIQTVELF